MEMRRPGLEPGTPAWKADMLTPTPTTHTIIFVYSLNGLLFHIKILFISFRFWTSSKNLSDSF